MARISGGDRAIGIRGHTYANATRLVSTLAHAAAGSNRFGMYLLWTTAFPGGYRLRLCRLFGRGFSWLRCPARRGLLRAEKRFRDHTPRDRLTSPIDRRRISGKGLSPRSRPRLQWSV